MKRYIMVFGQGNKWQMLENRMYTSKSGAARRLRNRYTHMNGVRIQNLPFEYKVATVEI